MWSSTVIPMPANDKDFEEKCIPLFAGLLNDPNVKTLGSRGFGQQGLDLFGARDRDPGQPVGIQCKLKTKGDKLTETEVRQDLGKALEVSPPLTEFYVATTASDEPAMDFLAMTLRREQQKLGRGIDIQIWGWETLQQKIRADQKALKAFDPGQSPAVDRLLELGEEALQLTETGHAETHALIREQTTVIVASVLARPADPGPGSALESHLDRQVDQYRDLINAGQPRTALDLLGKLEAELTSASSAAIRARVRGNIGSARLRLGEESHAGRLLLEAYVLNPDNPRIVSNRVLGLILTGDVEGALAFAREALAADPTNDGVAGFVFHIATSHPDLVDPMTVVPPSLLGELGVRIYRISYHRAREETEAWRALSEETYAEFPDDDTAARMAADAWLEEAFEQRAFERNPVMPPRKAELLRRGAELLAQVWDRTRTFENRAQNHLLTIGINLANAYRGLDDIDAARRVSGEILAIAPDDPEVLATALYIALETDDLTSAQAHVSRLPEGPLKSVQTLNVLARLQDWPDLISAATDARRKALSGEDAEAFDTLLYRARCAHCTGVDVVAATEALLAAYPRSVGTYVIAADVVRAARPEEAKAILAKAVELLNADTPYGDRLMLSELATFLTDLDVVILCLDGFVRTDRPSRTLAALAWAFANATPRPRTHAFFEELAASVLADPAFARLAGVAESARGDLIAAERHLRVAVEGEPRDLRAHLQLASVLHRQNRPDAANAHVKEIDEGHQRGDAMDLMRLAHSLRRAGEAERALALGYATVRAHPDDAEVAAAYPALILMPGSLPTALDRVGPAGEGLWFRLEGDGLPEVQGVIEAGGSVSQGQYPPGHPLAQVVAGKALGDTVILERDLGPDQTYVLKELKPKYVWLLHDVMAAHATRFPDSNSLLTLSIVDKDVQPVLDTVRRLSEGDRQIAQAYVEAPIPLAAMAAMSRRSVIELAEHLADIDGQVRTCAGGLAERDLAMSQARGARGRGAVLDTLTVWTAYRLGLLESLKAHFGRLCVPRSTMDTFLELREAKQIHCGQEYMTIGYRGDQPFRDVRTPQDTERVVATIDEVIAQVEAHCEILPSDGADDLRLDGEHIDRFAAGEVLDPIHLARNQGLLLLSDDLHLRQLASAHGAKRGAWLQVACRVMADEGLIGEPDYCIMVGQLGALRHGHLWLDVKTFMGLRRLDDPRREGLFKSAIVFIGGPNAELKSHIAVVLGFLRATACGEVETGGSGRAADALITRLLAGQSRWRQILAAMEQRLSGSIQRGEPGAVAAAQYLGGWIKGHFLHPAAAGSEP